MFDTKISLSVIEAPRTKVKHFNVPVRPEKSWLIDAGRRASGPDLVYKQASISALRYGDSDTRDAAHQQPNGSRSMDHRLVVLAKQVPDTTEVTAEAMKKDGTVNRAALPTIVNPDDLHALEMALQVRERRGGEVVVITMGPPAAADLLRDMLYRGADRGVLITDRRAAASDTLATSYILAKAVEHLGAVDAVFCGRQAIDGDTAQVGPQVAEKLGIPQVTFVDGLLDAGERTLRLSRDLGSAVEEVEAPLPCLLTVTDKANVPRPHGARRLMQFKRARAPVEIEKEASAAVDAGEDPEAHAELVNGHVAELEARGLFLEQWDLDTIGADLIRCGRSGSPTKVKRVQGIVLQSTGREDVPATREGIRDLVHSLITDHTIG